MEHTAESRFAGSQNKSFSHSKTSEEKPATVTSNKIFADVTCENEFKSSQISSSLDRFCKNNLNESSDFIDCDSKNKFKQKKSKIELFYCQICKEDITHLDIHGRGLHVNNCIDKQISSTTVSITQTPETENIFILECPLCFKNFSSPELRAHHIKKCGKSKGLGTQAILKALELQERHALERVALGLPSKPPKPVKSHKSAANKKAAVEPKNKTQSDIQLAKAISLSLADTHHSQGDSLSAAISAPVSLLPPAAQQNPGKKSSKHRKGLMGTPLLVLRTEDDRQKLLRDKVAAILASKGEDNDAASSEQLVPDVGTKKNPNEAPVLWQLSSLSSDKWDYYVEQLLDWIVPSNVEVGAKLGHLSQIAGHEVVTQLPVDYTFSSQDKSDSPVLPFETDQAVPSVISSLQSLVASSWMSDVDIHTSCGTVIPAHKLLLALRCPPLKQDLSFCSSSGKAILKWENTSFNVALQFLNFVYTGHLERDETMVSDLLDLAKKYELHDLEVVLNSYGKTESPLVESYHKFYQDTGDHPTTHLASSPESQQGLFHKSQDDTNTDLEIVFNCISSSLRPTQPASQQQLSSPYMKSPEFSSKSITKDNPNSPIAIDDDSNDLKLDENHGVQAVSKSFSEKSHFLHISDEDTNDLHVDDNYREQAITESFSERNCFPLIAEEDPNALYIDEDHEVQMISKPCSEENPTSPLSDECASELIKDSPKKDTSSDIKSSSVVNMCLSASPVIFDVNDSEDDLLDEGNDQIMNSYSQKSKDRVLGERLKELDMNSAESNSSEDSVKILKSSHVSLGTMQKECDDVRISKSSRSLPCINKTRWNASPQKEPQAEACGFKGLQNLNPENLPYDSIDIYSNIRFESFNRRTSDESSCLNKTRWNASSQKEPQAEASGSKGLKKRSLENLPCESSDIYSSIRFEPVNKSSKLHLSFSEFSADKEARSSSKFNKHDHEILCNSSPVNFNKRKLTEHESKSVKNVRLNSPRVKDNFQIISNSFGKELSGFDELDSTLKFPLSQKSPPKNKLLKNMQISNSPNKKDDIQMRKCFTGEKLCDYGEVEYERLPLLSSQKPPAKIKFVKNAETSNRPSNNNSDCVTNSSVDKECNSHDGFDNRLLQHASHETLVKASTKQDSKEYSPKGRNVSPEILFCDSDSAMSPPPNYKADEDRIIPNISETDSVERMRKNIASPEVICFISDNETSPLDESSSFQKELHSKKANVDKTSLVTRNSSEESKSNDIGSPKLLGISYQFMDDFVFEEPYADFEPEIPTPRKEMVEHHSDSDDNYSARNLAAKDAEQQGPIEVSLPDTARRKAVASQLQLVSNKSKKKSPGKVSQQAATPSNNSGGTITPKFYFTDSPITPLPDFKTMKTPDIKQALKKFGVKAMPRRKAVALLSHIYNETHPLINGETEASSAVTPPKKTTKRPAKCKKRKLLAENDEEPAKKAAPKKVLAPNGILLSSDSDDCSFENSEAVRLGCIPEISSSQCTQDSPSKDGDAIEKIKKYILSNDQLHTNILMYRPLNIVTFQQELKSNGIKIGLQKLMDHFDDQGITFTYPRNEEKQKKRTIRSNNFRKRMIAKMSQQPS